MSYYDSLRLQFGMLPAEDRLRILRAESMRWLSLLHGQADLLQITLAHSGELIATRDLLPLSQAIAGQAACLHDVLDAIVFPQQHDDRGMAELRPYDSLVAAILETARREGLPLAVSLADSSHVTIHMQYPLILQTAPPSHRQCHLDLDTMQYRLDVSEWKGTTTTPTLQFVHQWVCPTLVDVTLRINAWLVEQWSVDNIVQTYG